MNADLVFPRTPAAAAALSVATRFCSPALLNHPVRCYLWGAPYGTAHGIAFDDELYYCEALVQGRLSVASAANLTGLSIDEVEELLRPNRTSHKSRLTTY